jgi:hypothetical protein
MNMAFSEIFSGGEHLLAAALLVCLIWIAVARPQRICNVMLFRIACWAFALGFLTPSFITLFFAGNGNGAINRLGAAARAQGASFALYAYLLSPMLYMASFMFAISSVALGVRSERGFEVIPGEPQETLPHQK